MRSPTGLANRAVAGGGPKRAPDTRIGQTLESLIAAYDTMRMVSPRHSAL